MRSLLKRLCPGAEESVVRRLRADGAWRKLANYLLVEWEAGRRSARMWGRPYWLTVDPTNFCQLKCPFCPTGAERGVRPKASMRVEHFRHLLKELGRELIHIDFMNWGEPLLNKDVYTMIEEAKACGVDTMLSTNLNAFDEASARRMVRSGLDRVVLSIDGLTQETYERYRINGDYARVIENLKTLVRVKREEGASHPHITWQFLVFKHNENEIERVRETALALGADEVGITAANMPFKPGIREHWLPTRREYSLYDAESFPDSPPWHWAQAKAEEGEAPPSVDVRVYREDKREPCNWPWAGIAVNPDGSVSPCCSVEEKEYDFGNVFENSFQSVWNNEKYRRARRHVGAYAAGLKDTVPNSSHACERCFSIGKSKFVIPHQWLAKTGEVSGI